MGVLDDFKLIEGVVYELLLVFEKYIFSCLDVMM